jgi:hypothetical protein
MPQTGAETVLAAGGLVAYAVAETAAPVNPTIAPAAAYNDLGYISEDGLTFSFGDEQEEIGAWQALVAIRRARTGQTFEANFNLRQWNELTLPVAFGGGAVDVPSAGIYRYRFPDPGDAIVERAFLVRWKDGARNFQLWVPRMVVSEPTETTLARASAADLPLQLAALQPSTGRVAEILTDDAQWAV